MPASSTARLRDGGPAPAGKGEVSVTSVLLEARSSRFTGSLSPRHIGSAPCRPAGRKTQSSVHNAGALGTFRELKCAVFICRDLRECESVASFTKVRKIDRTRVRSMPKRPESPDLHAP